MIATQPDSTRRADLKRCLENALKYFAASLAVVLPTTLSASAEPLRLLFMGNSFTMRGDVATDLGRLAVAGGHEAPLIVTDLYGGKDLDYHIEQVREYPENNVRIGDLAEGQTWTHVILQGYSTEATHLGDRDDFVNDVHTLYTAVRDDASGRGRGVVGVLYQTWARGPSHQYYIDKKFADPAAMQREINAGYEAARRYVAEKEGADAVRVAPVGEAFASLDFDESLIYGDDNYHQNEVGALLASLVLYRTIYQEDAADIGFDSVADWAGVSRDQWDRLVRVADGFDLGALSAQ